MLSLKFEIFSKKFKEIRFIIFIQYLFYPKYIESNDWHRLWSVDYMLSKHLWFRGVNLIDIYNSWGGVGHIKPHQHEDALNCSGSIANTACTTL